MEELRRNMWFQMDECPAHYSSNVRNRMDQDFPVDLYLQGKVERVVYDTTEDTREKLTTRIVAIFDNVKEWTSARSVQRSFQVALR